MDDYSALAYRIAGGVADVRGCLILSRDGLILGSYPDDETAVKPAWVRFASLGDPERSFVEFGDQVWVLRQAARVRCLRRGQRRHPSRPGDRSAREHPDVGRGVPEPPRHAPRARGVRWAPAKPPSSIRRVDERELDRRRPPAPDSAEARHWSRATPPAVDGAAADPVKEEMAKVASGVGRSGDATPADGPTSDPNGEGRRGRRRRRRRERSRPTAPDAKGDADPKRTDAEKGTSGGGAPAHTNGKAADKPAPMELDADAEVDPVMLAKEFSGLLQVESGDDEASS